MQIQYLCSIPHDTPGSGVDVRAPSPLSCPQQVQHPGQAVVSKQSSSVRARIAFARRNPEQTMLPQGAAVFLGWGIPVKFDLL